jgi:drug/metabolite transporter (DMT)-like permease
LFGTLNKRYIEYGAALTVTGLEMTAGVACLTLLAVTRPFGMDPIIIKPDPRDAVLLAVLAIGCTLVPFALSLVALRRLSAFTTSLAVNMEPVYDRARDYLVRGTKGAERRFLCRSGDRSLSRVHPPASQTVAEVGIIG